MFFGSRWDEQSLESATRIASPKYDYHYIFCSNITADGEARDDGWGSSSSEFSVRCEWTMGRWDKIDSCRIEGHELFLQSLVQDV
ncbi:hypothetical protein QTP88_002486 [Uroleucon formosanum]